jgi:hypothetical protein
MVEIEGTFDGMRWEGQKHEKKKKKNNADPVRRRMCVKTKAAEGDRNKGKVHAKWSLNEMGGTCQVAHCKLL